MISPSVTAFAQSEIRRANSWFGGLTLSGGIVAREVRSTNHYIGIQHQSMVEADHNSSLHF